MDKQMGLGKGLSTLMGDDIQEILSPVSVTDASVIFLDVEKIYPGVYQPRRIFDEEALKELIASIKEKGVLQPLLVRPHPTEKACYEVIAGERRLRASKAAGIKKVPVLVKMFDDKTTLEVALIENLQRENLNPFEEAQGYERLMDEFQYTQETLSKVVGKSRSHVANMIRMLELPDGIKRYVTKKELTLGHARALLGLKNAEDLAETIVKKGLTVRQTEKLAAQSKERKETSISHQEKLKQKDKDIITLETELSKILKNPVSISWNGKGGKIVISYQNLDQLDILLQRLMQTVETVS